MNWQRTIATVTLVFLPLAAMAGEVGKPAGEAPSAFRTWAVLSTPNLRGSGLEDQIIAGLSRDRAIRLVDREHLNLVAGELSLGGMLMSSGAGLRQKAGEIVKADALLLLSRETLAGKDFVRVVVCECHCGARLRVDCIAIEEGKVEATAKRILAAIEDTRRHFSRGVQLVVGVPPFVSRSLTHEYDYLQRGYSALLADALSLQPGVAVIEVDEAQQIAREISLTDGKNIDRMVPLFVEGEYEVARNGAEEPLVDFRVKIRGKNEARMLPARKVRVSQCARYVGMELPGLIAGLANATAGITFTPDQQSATLIARADAFATLGAWEHSTGLREAALLLRDNVAQRTKLVDEYCRIVEAPLPAGIKLDKATEPYASLCTYRWAKWRLAVAHLEYLVRNQQADGGWASRTAQRMFHTSEATYGIRLAAEAEVSLAEQTRKRFLRDCYLPFSRLKVNGGPALSYWSTYYNGFAWHRLDWKPIGKEDLAFQVDMMENVIPEEVDSRRAFVFYAADFAGKEPAGLTREEFAEFLSRLDESARPVNVFVARMGRLYWNWSQQKDTKRSKDDLLAEAESLLKSLDSIPKFAARNSDWEFTLTELRKEIRFRMAPPTTASRSASPEPPPSRAMIAYEAIPFQVRGRTGGTTPLKGMRWKAAAGAFTGPHFENSGLRLLNCGGRLDVIWEESAVLLHRQKGILEEILVDPAASFCDAQWDGKDIWIASRSGSIRVLAPDGTLVATIAKEQGLIDCDQALRLFPLEPGKVCAVGSFGPNHRAWCAIVELKDGKAEVNVFHRATRVKTSIEERRSMDADYVFVPRWMASYANPGATPLILVARQTGLWEHMPPLAIDPRTLAVTVPDGLIEVEKGGDGFYFLDTGQVLQFGRDYVLLRDKPSAGVQAKPRELVHFDGEYGWQRAFLPWHGKIYVPNHPWYRIDPVTLKAERLAAARAPLNPGYLGRFAISSHYGMVVSGSWTDGFFRIRVADDDAIPP